MPRGFDAALNHTGTDCHVGQTVDDDEGSGGDVALVGIEIQCLREVDFAKPNFIQFQYGRRARFQRVDVDLVMDGADLAGQGLAGVFEVVLFARQHCGFAHPDNSSRHCFKRSRQVIAVHQQVAAADVDFVFEGERDSHLRRSQFQLFVVGDNRFNGAGFS